MNTGRAILCMSVFFICACSQDDGTPISPERTADEIRLKDVAGEVWMGMTYDYSSDDTNREIFEREANAGQVGWYPAWGGWTDAFTYDFSELNTEVNYVHDQGLPIMMHMLFGADLYLPEWFKNGTWTNDEMDAMMQSLIENIMQSNENSSKVDVWNVINEAIGWDGDTWEHTTWLQLGFEDDASGLSGVDKVFDSIPAYIGKVFEYARLHTDSELELRDYLNDGIESRWDNSELRTKAFFQLTMHLVNSGVPIDAVGFQGHINIDVPATFSGLTQTIQKYKALGLKVYITELDAEQNDGSRDWNASISQAQADYYYDYVSAALEGGADGIFTWGIRDDQDPWWRFGEHPLLFDADGNSKDAYFAVRQAFIDFRN